MSEGLGTIAGIVAGFKAGQISESVARRLLREMGCDGDVASILCIGAGIVGGMIVGDIIADSVSDIFDSLF